MIEAERVLSTPRTDSSLSRRRALAGFAALAAGLPAAAAAVSEPDPIFAAIERHRAAVAARTEAVRVEFRFEEETCCSRDMNAEQRRQYRMLQDASRAAWDHLDDVSGNLVNTEPATLAGIVALCSYLEPILNDPEAVDLPEFIHWEDGSESTPAAAFANVISIAARTLIGRAGS